MSNGIKVVKRNGSIEPIDLEKMHNMCEQACEGLAQVSASQVEINSGIQFFDGITTAQIQEILIKSASDLISLEHPNYQFVASRLLLFSLRKGLYGRLRDMPHLRDQIQGGIDKGESYLDAAYRELKEETSIQSVSLIKEIEDYITYDLPDHLLGIIWRGKFKGQKQKWFIMRFYGKDSEININTKKAEFLEWKWTDIEQITNLVVDFKLDIYKKLKSEIKKIISN